MNRDIFGSIAGKTILFTGAAGGLGYGATLRFLETGARVVAIDNNAENISALRDAASDNKLSGLVVETLDISELKAFRGELESISGREGGFDAVINNAAIYPSKPFEEFTIEEMQFVQRVNVDASIVCVQVALPHMKRTGRGRIINMASITVFGLLENLAPYVQSKAALIGLARIWAREFGKYGVTANAVSPGAFPTDAEKIHADIESYVKRIFDHQAIQRRGNTNDIAELLMFLLSDASSFITGQTINIDGGWMMC